VTLEQDIIQIEHALANTPTGSPDFGHLSTILIGLKGEQMEKSRGGDWEPVFPFPFPPIPRWLAREFGGKR